jgi:hypothetical protein
MISTAFKDLNFYLFVKSLVFFICLFDVRLSEDDLKKIEIFRSISGLYVEMYTLMLVLFSVLSIKKSCYTLWAR